MAALLVAIAVLSVVMLVALPTWRQQAQREKEAELVWRGEQYARAIGLYQRKLAGAFPPSLDVLVEQKFLRKKYKDPITGQDFVPVMAGTPIAMAAQELDQATGGASPSFGRAGEQAGAPRTATDAGPGGVGTSETPGGQTSTSPFGQSVPGGVGAPIGGGAGIVGVASRSTARSIMLYKGRTRYDQWVFLHTAVSTGAGGIGMPGQTTQPDQTPGAALPGATTPGAPQQPGGGQ